MQRLQKILAAAGLGSRRECEQFILDGRVSVDGKIITMLGAKADPDTQVVRCDGENVKLEKKRCYLFYKPKNCLCTNAPADIPRVIDYFRSVSYRLFTVGRLDKDSEGLLLVTNDGSLSQQLAHPRHKIEKIYHVTVKHRINPDALEKLREGAWVKEGKIVPDRVRLLKAGINSSILEIVLTEGKNREIRRLCAKVGHAVVRLIRVRIGELEIGDLNPGQYRLLSKQEIQESLQRTTSPKKGLSKKDRANEARIFSKINGKSRKAKNSFAGKGQRGRFSSNQNDQRGKAFSDQKDQGGNPKTYSQKKAADKSKVFSSKPTKNHPSKKRATRKSRTFSAKKSSGFRTFSAKKSSGSRTFSSSKGKSYRGTSGRKSFGHKKRRH